MFMNYHNEIIETNLAKLVSLLQSFVINHSAFESLM